MVIAGQGWLTRPLCVVVNRGFDQFKFDEQGKSGEEGAEGAEAAEEDDLY